MHVSRIDYVETKLMIIGGVTKIRITYILQQDFPIERNFTSKFVSLFQSESLGEIPSRQ